MNCMQLFSTKGKSASHYKQANKQTHMERCAGSGKLPSEESVVLHSGAKSTANQISLIINFSSCSRPGSACGAGLQSAGRGSLRSQSLDPPPDPWIWFPLEDQPYTTSGGSPLTGPQTH